MSAEQFRALVIKIVEVHAFFIFALFISIGAIFCGFMGYIIGSIFGSFIRIVFVLLGIALGGGWGFSLASMIYGVIFILLDIRASLHSIEGTSKTLASYEKSLLSKSLLR